MNNTSPFGIRYQGNVVNIKLRFHPKKLVTVSLEKYGITRTTSNGYVIFEASLDTESTDYNRFLHDLEVIRAAK